MNRSFSKIKHIQESNQRLEKRLLGKETKETNLSYIVKPNILENKGLCDNDDCKGEFENKLSETINSLEDYEVDYLYVALINKLSDWVETNNIEKFSQN